MPSQDRSRRRKLRAYQSKLASALLMAFGASLFVAGCSKDDGQEPSATKSQNAKPFSQSAQAASKPLDPVAAGKKVFRSCTSCHTSDKGGKNRIGPNLYGIYGAKAGSHEGFAYSKAFQNSEIIWNDETLNLFLERPSKYIPNNRMSYGGVRNEEKRLNLIAYLKTLNDQ